MSAGTALGGNDGRTDSEPTSRVTTDVLVGGGDLAGVVRGGLIPGEEMNDGTSGLHGDISLTGDLGRSGAEAVVSDAPPAPDVPQPIPPPAVDAGSEVAPGSRAAIICAVFGDQCAKALRVAECESGPDYSADWDGTYVGAFQLYPGHAAKFSAHGWDYYSEGNDPYKNATIALEILAGRGYVWTGSGGWPMCGYK